MGNLQKQTGKIFLIISLFFIFVIIFISNSKACTSNISVGKGVLSTKQIKKNVGLYLDNKMIIAQEPLHQEYLAILNAKQYSIDDMYVKLNPYGTSPLSALVIFDTDEPAQVTYRVLGKSEHTDISNEVRKQVVNHEIPIVGLYPDYENTIIISIHFANGETTEKQLKIKTASLPESLSKNVQISVKKADKTKMVLGRNKLTVMNRTTGMPFAIDADGNIRWYSTNYNQHIFNQLKDGKFLLMTKKNIKSNLYNELIITDGLGVIYKQYHFSSKISTAESMVVKNVLKSEGTTAIHHDIIELPNGDFLATISDGSKYMEDTMIEFSRNEGKIIRVIDFKRIFPKKFYEKYKSTKRADKRIDWLHQNSVFYNPKNKSITISSRHQDLVMQFDYKTMKPIWIFCGISNHKLPKNWRKCVLKPIDGARVPGGQHNAQIVNYKNKNQEDLLYYDNNYSVTNGEKKTSEKFSEGVMCRIDKKKMTIRPIWSYGKTLGKDNFTDRVGSTYKLSDKNYLIDFGYLNAKNGSASNIVETHGEEPVFSVAVNLKKDGKKRYVYRAPRIEFFSKKFQFSLEKLVNK